MHLIVSPLPASLLVTLSFPFVTLANTLKVRSGSVKKVPGAHSTSPITGTALMDFRLRGNDR